MWPAPTPRKKTIATETDTEEKHANGARGETSQETEEIRVAAKPAWELTSRWRTFSRQNIKYGWAHGT